MDNKAVDKSPDGSTVSDNPIELSYLHIPDKKEDGSQNASLGDAAQTNYGSTYSIDPAESAAASTTHLVPIDADAKIDRHTGEERETWDNRAQFVLSLIGYAVGLGNVWRFPYLTQKNGGGAFLIPYTIMLAIEGIPLFYLELAIGQRLRKGAVGAWSQISPYMAGLGVACAVVSFNVALYYNTIMSWCIFYLIRGFQSPLPWANCPTVIRDNISVIADIECEKSGPTNYFWYRVTLNTAADISSPSDVNWKIILCLLAAWLVVYLCTVKGIKSSGKVVYVTATFPYLVLVIFFFRGVTLPGFERGLAHLFIPDWGRLRDPTVWLDAASQIFYSFGLAFGCLIALSSYNPVRNNFRQQALIVTIADYLTAIFTAIVVFSILGFKATREYEKCLANYTRNGTYVESRYPADIDELCNFKRMIEESASGSGLAFIAFTEAINQFPVAPLWSVLFFLMLFTLGLDSMFGTLEGALTSIYDVAGLRVRKELVCGLVCLGMCLVSFCFATSTGPYVFELFDDFCANMPLLIIGFCECIGVAYVYGLKRFSDDIELMIGERPGYYWLFCIRFLAPISMIIIFIASIIDMALKGTSYSTWDPVLAESVHLPWPWWCKIIAAVLILASVLWIPGVALVRYIDIIPWNAEPPAFFPTEELRAEREIEPREITFMEKYFLGFKE